MQGATEPFEIVSIVNLNRSVFREYVEGESATWASVNEEIMSFVSRLEDTPQVRGGLVVRSIVEYLWVDGEKKSLGDILHHAIPDYKKLNMVFIFPHGVNTADPCINLFYMKKGLNVMAKQNLLTQMLNLGYGSNKDITLNGQLPGEKTTVDSIAIKTNNNNNNNNTPSQDSGPTESMRGHEVQ